MLSTKQNLLATSALCGITALGAPARAQQAGASFSLYSASIPPAQSIVSMSLNPTTFLAGSGTVQSVGTLAAMLNTGTFTGNFSIPTSGACVGPQNSDFLNSGIVVTTNGTLGLIGANTIDVLASMAAVGTLCTPFVLTGSTVTPPTVVTVSQDDTICPGISAIGTIGYTNLVTAINGIGGDFTRVYDMKICPSVSAYVLGGPTVEFDGTIEAAGTGVVIQDETISLGNAPQALVVLDNDNEGPAPGEYLEIKGITFEGTILSGGPPYKQVRCVQVVGGAYYRFEDDTFVDCQDGVQGTRWGSYATGPWGLIVWSNSTWNNDGSSSGPSHGVYVAEADMIAGGTFAVPASMIEPASLTGTLTPGGSIYAGDSIIAAGSFNVVGSITGNVLDITNINSGTVYPGTTAIVNGTSEIVASQISGTTGGVGDYYMSIAGQTIAPGTTITGSYPKLLLVDAIGNQFGSMLAGYALKMRAGVFAVAENNTFVLNYNSAVVGSGAIDETEGATGFIINNTVSLGPYTGTSANPAYAFLTGNTEGLNVPDSYLFAGDTVIAQGTSVLLTVISSQTESSAINIVNGTYPNPTQLAAYGLIQGLGTVGPGNFYASGTAIPQSVVLDNFYGLEYSASYDYRGTGTPKTLAIPNGYAAWGGNGLFTASPATAGGNYIAALGGPGGLTWNAGTLGAYYFILTDAGATDTVNEGAASAWAMLLSGSDTINFTGSGCANGGNNVNVMPGAAVTVNESALVSDPECLFYVQGHLNLQYAGGFGTGFGSPITFWPGSTINATGTISGINGGGISSWQGTGGDIAANLFTVGGSFGTGQNYVFDIDGGTEITGPKNLNVGAWWIINTYEDAPSVVPIVTLGGTIAQVYSIAAQGGGTFYAGDNLIDITGSGRDQGPYPIPISVHVQNAESGSYLNLSGPGGPINVYDDGPGDLKVAQGKQLTNSTAPFYLELDANAGGTVLIASGSWTPPYSTCALNGNSIVSEISSGGTYDVTLASGGIVQIVGVTSLSCPPV